jgi:hypothetical protein
MCVSVGQVLINLQGVRLCAFLRCCCRQSGSCVTASSELVKVLSRKLLSKTPVRSGVGTVFIGRNPLPLGMGRFKANFGNQRTSSKFPVLGLYLAG